MAVNHKKPIKLQNLTNESISVDSLYHSSIEKVPCDGNHCCGSLLKPIVVSSKRRRSKDEILFHAEHFLAQYFASIKRLNSGDHEKRLAQVREHIEKHGTYSLKETELIFGAKLAWRNAPRCIGRIQWSKLQVFDARYVTSAKEMFDAICNHIKYATNKGNLRSAITIFPQRTAEDADFRIWNPQLISYAGYPSPENPRQFIGDPINVEFTQLCMKLGWKPEGTPFDILPIVVSAAGQDPQYFPIPEELVLRVPLEHPKFEWFKELKLQWYALPAVSSMLLDLGGIEFPTAPFSGWYMVTEIACRDLCDVNRYNILERVADKMGLDVRSNMTLWRDEALVEINKAVVESFHRLGVTIVDHHTAAESFMKHLENEQRLRGGCPADWVWIVPPTSGSLTPVFHQEMINYHLKPSFEYQEPAWKNHTWNSSPNSDKAAVAQARKRRFKEIARAVKFTSNLFGKALSKRIKATILFATETGRSEEYAKRLEQIFSYAFNVTIMCMDSYDTFQLEHEALLLIVTSTFGNGDPPENGESFARQLQAIKVTGDTTPDIESVKSVSTSYLRIEPTDKNKEPGLSASGAIISHIGPLSNIRFAVFGLGSSAYPNFCAFAKYLDNMLGELGGERINKVYTGDELCGQEQSFNQWSKDVFTRACEVFCITDEINLNDVMKTAVMKPKTWSIHNCKLVPLPQQSKRLIDIVKAFSKCSNRKVIPFRLIDSIPLHKGGENERQTIRVVLEQDDCGQEITPETILNYQPGDHLGIFPENPPELVREIMNRLPHLDFTTVFQVFLRKAVDDGNGEEIEYIPHQKLAPCSLEEALTRYLDITTPPTQQLLNLLSIFCRDDHQKDQIEKLASEPERFEEWKAYKYPNFFELLMEFDTLQPPAEVLFTQLPILQPRFYSISSSDTYYSWLSLPSVNGVASGEKSGKQSEKLNNRDGGSNQTLPDRRCSAVNGSSNRNVSSKGLLKIDLTVAVVRYETQSGSQHQGVCSNFLANLTSGHEVFGFLRSAPNFRMPTDHSVPLIMVGPGTGIAPFRAFWLQRYALSLFNPKIKACFGPMSLFFGCRTPEMELYSDETCIMKKENILTQVSVAFSRVPGSPKQYVQDLLKKSSSQLCNQLIREKGHFYVCGDVSMAEGVCQTLRSILQENGFDDPDFTLMSLRKEGRYHEDIFGITLRTDEVRRKGRNEALTRKGRFTSSS